MDFKKPLPPAAVAEGLIAVLLILWRVWEVPVVGLWRDWITVLSIFWLFQIMAPAGRAKAAVTFGAMAGLAVLYGWGQFPHVFALLRSLT